MEQSQAPQDPTIEERDDGSGTHAFVVLQPGEKIICKIKRHPIGVLSMYFAAGVAIAVIIVLVVIIGPGIVDQYLSSSSSSMTSTQIMNYLYTGAGVVSVLVALILMVATVVYWQNEWIVTDDSVTQINQISLFTREVSQVPMGSLEDVSVDQHGIIQTMFNFGTLKLESAGEKSKFQFAYCPRPNYYARQILTAHEEFAKRHETGVHAL